jgi:hypothetical protein
MDQSPGTRALRRFGELIGHSRELCREAETAKAKAVARRIESRNRRLERRNWHALWSECIAHRDHIIVTCAYCGQMRAGTGEWITPPPGLLPALRITRAVLLSHGYCPECVA